MLTPCAYTEDCANKTCYMCKCPPSAWCSLTLHKSSVSWFIESESAHYCHYLGLLCLNLCHWVHPCCFSWIFHESQHAARQGRSGRKQINKILYHKVKILTSVYRARWHPVNLKREDWSRRKPILVLLHLSKGLDVLWLFQGPLILDSWGHGRKWQL